MSKSIPDLKFNLFLKELDGDSFEKLKARKAADKLESKQTEPESSNLESVKDILRQQLTG